MPWSTESFDSASELYPSESTVVIVSFDRGLSITRLLNRGAAITDVQHLLGHSSVKTTEKAYAAFVKNERFKQTIDLLDQPVQPRLKIVK